MSFHHSRLGTKTDIHFKLKTVDFAFNLLRFVRDRYHAAHADPLTAEIKRNLAFVLHDVPAMRVTDTCFWFMIYRMMVYPDEANGPKLFYERLLPYLNSKPLMANIDEATPWRREKTMMNFVL